MDDRSVKPCRGTFLVAGQQGNDCGAVDAVDIVRIDPQRSADLGLGLS